MSANSVSVPLSEQREIEVDSRVENSRHIKVAIHSHFYHWCQSWVKGKVVLDVGCGGGFGTAALAETADRVVGVDIDPQIIRVASNLYQLDNIEFQTMDCQKMSFQPSSFDVVVCNALFEYLPDVEAFMQEAFLVLKPNGIFICGTKNFELSLKSSAGRPLYWDHFQEFNPPELRSELEKYYTKVRLYGERMKVRSEAYVMDDRALRIEGLLVAFRIKQYFPRSWRNKIRKLITGVDVNDITSDDFEIIENSFDSALYLIALGSKP